MKVSKCPMNETLYLDKSEEPKQKQRIAAAKND